ncbi:uncharacterized protein I303_104991 [Kwoniella dejecticola CBS 10117]|uniref:NmrA-like domain-containing protein n=1 Tax=Kwoniella dejecticola CBS 10117 TaxID=1296121 RepID=A0AAJ8KRT3_9TREE
MSDVIKNVLLAGGTGRVGQFILRALVKEESLTTHILTRDKNLPEELAVHSTVPNQQDSGLAKSTNPPSVRSTTAITVKVPFNRSLETNRLTPSFALWLPTRNHMGKQFNLIAAAVHVGGVKLFKPWELGVDTCKRKRVTWLAV